MRSHTSGLLAIFITVVPAGAITTGVGADDGRWPSMSDARARDLFILAGSRAAPLTAQTMRQSVIVSSLPTFSCTASPMQSSEGGMYAVLRDHSKLWQLLCIEAPSLR